MPDQPLFVWLALFALIGIGGAVVLVGPLVWFTVFWRLCHRQSVLEHEPRRLASWGLIDLIGVVLLTFAAMFILMGIAALLGLNVAAALNSEDLQGGRFLIAVDSLSKLFAIAVIGGFILLRTGCSLRDLGLSWEHFGHDLRLGAAAFTALAIPTYALQGLLTRFWPSEHPLIESLKADRDPMFLGIALFAAVIAAPLAEEFVFRGLFQGWLEKMFDAAAIFRPNYFLGLIIGENVADDRVRELPPDLIQAELAQPNEPRSIYLGPPPLYGAGSLNPYVSPQTAAAPSEHAPPAEVNNFPHWITDVIPTAASSAVFALLHLSHGPDFIPLTFLAVGLGYLYRRTHRITPGLVVHFLLNLTSMLALSAAIYGEGLPQ